MPGRCLLGVGQRVTAIKPGQTWRVETSSGNSVYAPAVVIALPPRDALELLAYAEALLVAADRSVAVYAACLDLGLSQLPEPRHNFALGLDEPLYLSVHSSAARLAPEGGALVHILRYLQPDQQLDKTLLLAELEGFADLGPTGVALTCSRPSILLEDAGYVFGAAGPISGSCRAAGGSGARLFGPLHRW